MKPLNDLTVMNRLPWGLRVRHFRVAAGLTQDELADRIGTTKATISKIERSTGSAKLDWVEKLAPALHVSIPAIAFGEDGGASSNNRVPVIGMIAAGNWREAIHTPDDYVVMPNATRHTFALRIDGDSVDRVAPHGSFVLIDPTNPALLDGGLFAVQNGAGEATLKRFRRSPDRLEPDSTNPEHKPILLGSEPVTVIGRAISVTTML